MKADQKLRFLLVESFGGSLKQNIQLCSEIVQNLRKARAV